MKRNLNLLAAFIVSILCCALFSCERDAVGHDYIVVQNDTRSEVVYVGRLVAKNNNAGLKGPFSQREANRGLVGALGQANIYWDEMWGGVWEDALNNFVFQVIVIEHDKYSEMIKDDSEYISEKYISASYIVDTNYANRHKFTITYKGTE